MKCRKAPPPKQVSMKKKMDTASADRSAVANVYSPNSFAASDCTHYAYRYDTQVNVYGLYTITYANFDGEEEHGCDS